jgi:hypothetical protein
MFGDCESTGIRAALVVGFQHEAIGLKMSSRLTASGRDVIELIDRIRPLCRVPSYE